MIVDIIKIAEDENTVCYKCEREGAAANIILVDKYSFSTSVVVKGDHLSCVGSERKLKQSISRGIFPDKLLLATG